MYYKFLPINTVIADLLLTIDEAKFNETKALNFAIRALRQIPANNILVEDTCTLSIQDNQGQLPKDLVYINQILDKSSSLPLRATTSNFALSCLPHCPDRS